MATYGVEPAAPTASLRTSESRLIAPSFLGEGSNGVLDGSGFCDGTKVRIGNDLAQADATVHDGGRTLRFKTPRLATPGPITILPPHGAAYKTADLEVDTFRSTRGLAFANYDYAGFSFEEAVDTFGAEELFQRINLCWPLKCIVRTPIPDVKALAVVQIIDWAMQSSAGRPLRHRARRPGLGAQPVLAAPLHHRRRVLADQERQRERLPRRPARDPGVVGSSSTRGSGARRTCAHSWNASARSSRPAGSRWCP